MKTFKIIISILLVTLLIITLFPFFTFAIISIYVYNRIKNKNYTLEMAIETIKNWANKYTK